MKLIYVAHPYQGMKENEEKADKIIKELYKRYPEHSFVSPIHGIRCGYDDVTISEGLSYCLKLLSKCDGIILCNGWENSVGCTAEAALANSLGIKTSLQDEWLGKEEKKYIIVSVSDLEPSRFRDDYLNSNRLAIRKLDVAWLRGNK
ncbi:hypothetical protein SDC9_80119 [bioreactor metagenome]|uniref:DUF4406 domain-containing protein n=1 Tax=bioreactor metagenome TaxID=1076179 RepID=A0A644Z490_9ZZZZ